MRDLTNEEIDALVDQGDEKAFEERRWRISRAFTERRRRERWDTPLEGALSFMRDMGISVSVQEIRYNPSRTRVAVRVRTISTGKERWLLVRYPEDKRGFSEDYRGLKTAKLSSFLR